MTRLRLERNKRSCEIWNSHTNGKHVKVLEAVSVLNLLYIIYHILNPIRAAYNTWTIFQFIIPFLKVLTSRGTKSQILEPTTLFIISWGFLIVEQIFIQPQVKQSVIISNKLVRYIRVPLRVAERFKTYDLKKLGNTSKITKLHRTIGWRFVLPPKWKFCQY